MSEDQKAALKVVLIGAAVTVVCAGNNQCDEDLQKAAAKFLKDAFGEPSVTTPA